MLSLVVGAMLFPLATRWVTPRVALIGASSLVAIGYLLFLPFHDGYAQVLANMIIAGIGSGALVAALPAAAAAAAPAHQTGRRDRAHELGEDRRRRDRVLRVRHRAARRGRRGGHRHRRIVLGYVTVWLVCGVTAAVAAVLLAFVPKLAFSDAPVAEGAAVVR